ncbi:hypothetical protein [Bordetella ansorpii]|nr:hypothetical protein [Bordetella ansorpii]
MILVDAMRPRAARAGHLRGTGQHALPITASGPPGKAAVRHDRL